ncbi:MAG TPA: zinc ribbon domain-containing protein [Terracidiphilus sp.]|nr:zinc ribbon domain-containing protein [Terracidiphilus sp.]
MYCSKCGSGLTENQPACPACGHPAGRSLLQEEIIAEQTRFDRNILWLSRCWLLFAVLSLALGVAGFFIGPAGGGYAGPYEPWPHPPIWNWTLAPSVVWILLVSRVVLSLVAAWGLKQRCEWCRPVAILAGAAAMTEFPIGLVLGAYTIAVLIGKHRAALYAHQG